MTSSVMQGVQGDSSLSHPETKLNYNIKIDAKLTEKIIAPKAKVKAFVILTKLQLKLHIYADKFMSQYDIFRLMRELSQ